MALLYYRIVLNPEKPEEYYTTPLVECPIAESTLAAMTTDFHICWDSNIKRWWYFDRRPYEGDVYLYGFGKSMAEAVAMYDLRKARREFNDVLHRIFGMDAFDAHIYPIGVFDTRRDILPSQKAELEA